MTIFSVGPTATQLHDRTLLTEEEEPRAAHETATVPAAGQPSSSASSRPDTRWMTPCAGVCNHDMQYIGANVYGDVYECTRCLTRATVLDQEVAPTK